jgi:hypothetical protein
MSNHSTRNNAGRATTSADANSTRIAEASSRKSVRTAARELIVSKVTPSKVNQSFRNSDNLRKAITANLKSQSKSTRDVAKRVKKAFDAFNPSQFSSTKSAPSNFLSPGAKVSEAIDKVIADGAEAIRTSPVKRSITLRLTDKVKSLVKETGQSGDKRSYGMIDLDDLVKHVEQGVHHPRSYEDVLNSCKAELDADNMLGEIEGSTKKQDSLEQDKSKQNRQSLTTEELIKHNVHLQIQKASAPESELRYDKPSNRPDQPILEQGVDSFRLRSGPSDVTSYHDFHSLQIAFNHVWAEIFDGELWAIGGELYKQYVRLKAFTASGEDDLKIDTVEDLKQLMNEIKRLSTVAHEGIPAELRDIDERIAELSNRLETAPGPEKVALMAQREILLAARNSASNSDADGSNRLYQLLHNLQKLLSEKYAFSVYAKDSINFGIMTTYRQTWEPQNYQVGDLVKTIPLAPKEVTRYTTRTVTKKTRAAKELEDNLQTRKSEATDTSRVDAEIVEKAQNTTSFTATATESFGFEETKINSTQTATHQQGKQSENVKKDFREAVLKSAQEYRQQHRTEIETNLSEETEGTTFHEIQNPNDELTVTYLFYELQRTYRISEKLHKLTPVVLVANDVPAPNEINDAWLVKHDWILKRVILDDSFRSALEYLTKSFVGAEANIAILRNNAVAHKEVVDNIQRQIRIQMELISSDREGLGNAVRGLASSQQQESAINTMYRIFDPLQLTAKIDTGAATAADAMVDYAKETLDRAEREKARLLSQLDVATTALQVAVDKLSQAVKDHYDRVAEIDRLRLHVKENILYYMQAIWRHEPPDQRFFRLWYLYVPIVTVKTAGVSVNLHPLQGKDATLGRAHDTVSGELPMPELKVTPKKLVEVADLDTVLGYKGNYTIFPLKENNYMTLHMMQDYLEVGDEILLRDPDEFGNYSVEQLQQLASCMHKKDPKLFARNRNKFRDLLIDRLTSSKKVNDLVVVPTDSLYIAALVDTHPLLEDFKLIHRALDVKKVQAEVRHAELENIRLASRALKGKDEDPDIEKKIIIQNGKEFVIDTE